MTDLHKEWPNLQKVTRVKFQWSLWTSEHFGPRGTDSSWPSEKLDSQDLNWWDSVSKMIHHCSIFPLCTLSTSHLLGNRLYLSCLMSIQLSGIRQRSLAIALSLFQLWFKISALKDIKQASQLRCWNISNLRNIWSSAWNWVNNAVFHFFYQKISVQSGILWHLQCLPH